MSKWLTNANIKLDGDLIKAASYIGFAKRKAAVWQQMSKYFATDITKIFPLADALIKINVGPEKKMIYISHVLYS